MVEALQVYYSANLVRTRAFRLVVIDDLVYSDDIAAIYLTLFISLASQSLDTVLT